MALERQWRIPTESGSPLANWHIVEYDYGYCTIRPQKNGYLGHVKQTHINDKSGNWHKMSSCVVVYKTTGKHLDKVKERLEEQYQYRIGSLT